ncbi:MAG: EF-hand domain-containing protein [Candidatus Eremiobacteraeota bacterium]|nr:EF-hand domain-containing protein [Candidatus Eremiobacteraeota bacterium]
MSTLTELQKRKLIHMFELLDVDGNGFLEFADFQAVIETLAQERGLEPNSAGYRRLFGNNRRIWKGLFKCDLNGDGQISLPEWLAYHIQAIVADEEAGISPAGLTTAIDSIARYFYELMDMDGDGQIQREDYRYFCEAHGIPDETVEESFQQLDRDGNGTLSLDEVVTLVREFYTSDDPMAPGNWFFGDF